MTSSRSRWGEYKHPVNRRAMYLASQHAKAVFLDRDGVINVSLDGDYVKSWDEFEFLPKAKEAIKALTDTGWDIIVVSNQAGISRGIMSAQAVEEINYRMVNELEHCGGKVRAVYYCPHRPDENCGCRKPKPGMLLQAGCELGINLSQSYLIGDSITDIQAGAQVGCTTILVKTGQGSESLEGSNQWSVSPDYIVSDLFEAVELALVLERARCTSRTR